MNEQLEEIVERVSQVILGKKEQVRLALTCFFAQGHLLIEDIPGIGKTTLAKVLSGVMGLSFRRVQCTSDMLPGDILGFSVFDQNSGLFTFHPGPIFTQVLLADEINRAAPKTQSALLEAMEEKQVTVEGETRKLEEQFFVIATQNPKEQYGTFSLPESQLDRFLMRVSMGYPDRAAENQLLRREVHDNLLAGVSTVIDSKTVLQLKEKIRQVNISSALLEYIQDIIDFTRNSSHFHIGLSPRAGLNLIAATRSWAFFQGRDYAIPEDLQHILLPVTRHRLFARQDRSEYSEKTLEKLFGEVPVP